MRFKKWMKNEEMTSTANVAGFQNRLMLGRRWWVSDWEDELATGKKRKKKQPYLLPQVQEGSGYEYSCVMFNLDKKDADKIIAWSKKNIPDNVLFTDGEKGREDEMHVTVLYGLHDNKPGKIKEIIQKFKPGSIKLGEISKFETEDCDVIKISVEGEILHKMNKALKVLPYSSRHASYKPHCTLAYVKKKSCDHLLGKRNFQGMAINLDSLVFSPANGHRSYFNLD